MSPMSEGEPDEEAWDLCQYEIATPELVRDSVVDFIRSVMFKILTHTEIDDNYVSWKRNCDEDPHQYCVFFVFPGNLQYIQQTS